MATDLVLSNATWLPCSPPTSPPGSSKVRMGRWFAENVRCPDEVDRFYGQVLKTLRLACAAAPDESPSQPDGTVTR
jgi:hypothetical protein